MKHRIVAILLLGMLAISSCTAGSTPPATRIPSAAPTPNAAGDFGILSQQPCGPPCFQGIRPGVTMFDDAGAQLANADLPCAVTEDPSLQPDARSLFCESGDALIWLVSFVAGSTVDPATLPVDEIRLRPPVQITVEELVRRYGPPDSLLASVNAGQRGMLLFYDRLQTSVTLPMQPAPVYYAVERGTPLELVVYQSAAGYESDQSDAYTLTHAQPWKGYGKYAENPGP